MHVLYYDRQGKPLPLERWAELLEDARYRVVAHSPLPDGRCVATVWFGIDYTFGYGIPLIFETMVFAGCGDARLLAQQRWETEAEARAGHAAAVEEWTTLGRIEAQLPDAPAPTEEAAP